MFEDIDIVNVEYNTVRAFNIILGLPNDQSRKELNAVFDVTLFRDDIEESKKQRKLFEFDLYGAEVKNSLTIKDSGFGGNLQLGKIKAGELRFTGLFVESDLNIWGSEILGPSFLGHDIDDSSNVGLTILGDLSAWYAKLDDIQIEATYVNGNFQLNHAQIAGQMFVSESNFKSFFVHGLKTEQLTLEESTFDRLIASSTSIEGSLTIIRSSIRLLEIYDAALLNLISQSPRRLDNIESFNPTANCPPRTLTLDSGAADRFGLSEANRKKLRLDKNDGKLSTCVDEIDAPGMVVKNAVDLSGYFKDRINLRRSIVGGTLSLADKWTKFGPSACLDLQNIAVDSIVLDAQKDSGLDTNNIANTKPSSRSAPIFVDIFGASFRSIQPSAPIPDSIDRETVANAALRMLVGKPNMECVSGGYKRGENLEFASYRPEIFDALAIGYEKTGNIDLARQIRIEKNRSYAAALPTQSDWHRNIPSKSIYMLADWVNGFGYENIKALLWLSGFILLGTAFTLIGEARLEYFVDRCRGLLGLKPFKWPVLKKNSASLSSITGKRAKRSYRPKSVQEKSIVDSSALAFSLDRAIPSLGLDTAFGTHNRPQIGPLLSIWFYFQRTACYVIIALMIAGAFNVFQ